jgi:hypothetical protein
MKIELTNESAKELKRLLFIASMNEASKMNSTGLSNVLYLISLIEAAEKEDEITETVETAE